MAKIIAKVRKKEGAVQFKRRKNHDEEKKKIIKLVEQGLTGWGGAKRVGIPYSTFRTWLRRDDDFEGQIRHAEETRADLLEDEAFRRGVSGVKKPVFYKGRKVGHERVYSDGLLTTLLKGAKPEKYAVSQHQLTGANGGPIQVDARQLVISRIESMTKRLQGEPSKK